MRPLSLGGAVLCVLISGIALGHREQKPDATGERIVFRLEGPTTEVETRIASVSLSTKRSRH